MNLMFTICVLLFYSNLRDFAKKLCKIYNYFRV